jgi:hypothetical protein
VSIEQQNRETLDRVLDGLVLTNEERSTFDWLATWDRCSVDNIARVILKVRDRAIQETVRATLYPPPNR